MEKLQGGGSPLAYSDKSWTVWPTWWETYHSTTELRLMFHTDLIWRCTRCPRIRRRPSNVSRYRLPNRLHMLWAGSTRPLQRDGRAGSQRRWRESAVL